MPETSSTIRLSARLVQAEVEEIEARLALPKGASAKLPSRGIVIVEGTINGFPFRAALDPDGKGSRSFKVNKVLRDAAGARVGDMVTVEITRVGDETETRPPMELLEGLAAVPRAQALWAEISPMARRDWILWISSARQEETRSRRIKKACSMLASGKRRVCCFGGLNWLTKDHGAAGGTWLPLPDPTKRSAPGSAK